jgi:hypothetical protein
MRAHSPFDTHLCTSLPNAPAFSDCLLRRWLLCIALLSPGASPAVAATFAVDDSASMVQQPSVQLKWRERAPGRRASTAADAVTRVNLILNTRPWAGKPAKIFMLLAPQSVRVTASWMTGGTLSPGQVQSGGRTLVFNGIAPASLQDLIEVRVTADGRELGIAQRLRFSYEIEVD